MLVLITGNTVALAKGLPVTELAVTTTRAPVEQPIIVILRFDPQFEIGDWPAVRDSEVAVIPQRRTTPQGWPLTDSDLGTPVTMSRDADGSWHGAVVMRKAGRYVLFSRSAFYLHRDMAVRSTLPLGPPPDPIHLRITRGSRA
jgi:hypothetical protein